MREREPTIQGGGSNGVHHRAGDESDDVMRAALCTSYLAY